MAGSFFNACKASGFNTYKAVGFNTCETGGFNACCSLRPVGDLWWTQIKDSMPAA